MSRPLKMVGTEEAARAVEALVQANLGWRPQDVRRLEEGDNWVWEARLGRRSVVVKSGAGNPELEAWACRQALSAGVRAPQVLAVGRSESFPYRFLILAKVGGVPVHKIDLGPGAWKRLLRRVGAQLSQLHSVKTEGFGTPDLEHLARHGQVRGSSPDWSSAIEGWLQRLSASLLQAGVLDDKDGRRIATTIDRHMPVLERWAESRLLHGDILWQHVFTDGRGRLRGIIDFEAIVLGDPAYDIAALTYRRPEDLAALLSGYAMDPAMGSELDARLRIYRLVRAMLEMRWGVAGQVSSDLMAARSAKLERVLLELERSGSG